MNTHTQTIVELERALVAARDDVRDATRRRPEPSSAEITKLQTAAHTAWIRLETAKAHA
jgi:hypothetical protein